MDQLPAVEPVGQHRFRFDPRLVSVRFAPDRQSGACRRRQARPLDEEETWSPGGASHWWLHQSLAELDAQLRAAPAEILRTAGVELENNYPHPMVSDAIARAVALEAFARIKNTGAIVNP